MKTKQTTTAIAAAKIGNDIMAKETETTNSIKIWFTK